MREKQISALEINRRIQELANRIDKDYKDTKESICMVGVLRGAFIFLADLSRLLNIPHTIDFISIGSYDKDKTGIVRLLMDTRESVSGKHVIIVEDIIDSGKTINYLIKLFEGKNVKSIKTCTLLRKNGSRENSNISYVGFDVSKEDWVVGYGMDYNNQYRTLADIWVLKNKRNK